MGRVIIRNNPDLEAIEQERALRFRDLPFKERWEEVFALIHLSIQLNGGKPLKEPQGKGLIIKKPTHG